LILTLQELEAVIQALIDREEGTSRLCDKLMDLYDERVRN
jgi:hypothetical protein